MKPPFQVPNLIYQLEKKTRKFKGYPALWIMDPKNGGSNKPT